MCLAVPARITKIDGLMATVERGGITRDVSLMLLPDAKPDDFVLVHAGFALERVNERDAFETDALLAEMRGAKRIVESLG